MPVDVASILHEAALSGETSSGVAVLTHAGHPRARVDVCPCGPVGSPAWERRENLTMYDAWYVALGEFLALPSEPWMAGSPGLRDLGATLCSLRARATRRRGPRRGQEGILPSSGR